MRSGASDEPTGLLIQNVRRRHDEAMLEVMTAGQETAEDIRPTRAERTLRSEMAKNNLEPETLTVAMN